ncbi:MAG: response regulator transcription factor [Notoacmeibacter sp.]|nr:response regulator transcription factor [Notoacmeibacter sp.]
MSPDRRSIPRSNGVQVSFTSGAAGFHHRKLLVISPPGTVSNALINAVESEFLWLSVECVHDFQSACEGRENDVHLILIDQQLINEFIEFRGVLAQKYPLALNAIMAGFRRDLDGAEFAHFIETRAIRGILPMDVNLDVWLSILRIMLKGGEYFPPGLFHARYHSRIGDREHSPTGGRETASSAVSTRRDGGGSLTMNNLTEREVEILAKVAQGNQNKIIAADLGLSEHTVKIHLHNIIHKLGVHNRTEAAALYYTHTNQRADDAALTGDNGPDDPASLNDSSSTD